MPLDENGVGAYTIMQLTIPEDLLDNLRHSTNDYMIECRNEINAYLKQTRESLKLHHLSHLNNILPFHLIKDEEAEETVSGSLGREINEIICPKLPTPPQSEHSSPCASPPPPPSTPPPEIVKEEFTLEYLLAQHSHIQSLIEKNRRRLDVLPQKRIWYRNSCLNENIHLYLTELRDRLENFLLDQYRQERDGYIDFPCQQHYLTKTYSNFSVSAMNSSK
jgi:hypothetical protein